MTVRELLKTRRVILDGGMGTLLQQAGLPAGTPPEAWSLSHPGQLTAIHAAYIEAGADVVLANTFGVNAVKYENYEQLVAAAVAAAKAAVAQCGRGFVALDIGPLGRLLEPLGDLPFEQAVDIFAATVRAGVAAGADLIVIETMTDAYETKAAALAAKENSDLPVFVSNAYDGSGKLMTGASPQAMVALLEGLRVDAVGVNCSLGPDALAPVVAQYLAHASLPVLVMPNAGLPIVRDGKTVYDLSPADFAAAQRRLAEMGACLLGGCCGTTPEYIAATVQAVRDVPFVPPVPKCETSVSSYTHAVYIGDDPVLIGERINPTGKPKLKEALRAGDIGYILSEGVRQAEAGVQILDVNVGLPGIDEAAMMCRAVAALQGVTDLPLQLDTADPEALERAARLYNGKPLINSVSGKKESMDAVFPVVQKYGGAVIALAIGEQGIPDTAEGRAAVIDTIVREAAKYGIAPHDIIADPLCMAVSSDPHAAEITLQAVRLIRQKGVRVSLGVSNVSFGLPRRDIVNAAFFSAALEAGLNAAIINPFAEGMLNVYHAYRCLHGLDAACGDYIAYAQGKQNDAAPAAATGMTLGEYVERGLCEAAETAARALLESVSPADVISGEIVPALDRVGRAFETGELFLPQLLGCAEAASAAMTAVRAAVPQGETDARRKVILATVKGDIHDIGKNIVRMMLESYGFAVIDLGRDVSPEAVLQAAQENACGLIGLSALMTTTVPAMEETVALLHRSGDYTVIVGGAVLTADYAAAIGADHYAPDAMTTVRLAEEYYAR